MHHAFTAQIFTVEIFRPVNKRVVFVESKSQAMDNKQEIATPEPSGDFQHVADSMKRSAFEVIDSADFDQKKEVEDAPLEVDSDSSNADSGNFIIFCKKICKLK